MNIEHYYSLVSDLMSLEEFKRKIEMRKEKYGHLLDDEAIAYLIVDELGRNPGNRMKIAELYDGINATVEATIIDIGKIETVKNHRIMRLKIADDSGWCMLVLWNDEIDSAIENIEIGKKVKVVNGYVKENRYGLQIGLGKWGILIFD